MLPLVKWAGGKRRLAEDIYLHVRPFKRWVEPFAGGAAMFWYLRDRHPEAKYWLNDINWGLISMYQQVRDNPRDVHRALSDFASDYPHEKGALYYAVRDCWNSNRNAFSPPEQAALLLFLNAACFNGIWRENKKGGFNVPFGRRKTLNLPSKEQLLIYAKALHGTQLTSVDALSGMTTEKDDCWYLDPPYYEAFTGYNGSWNSDSQTQTADLAKALLKKGVQVLVSNSDTSHIRNLYEGWRFIELSSNYSVRPHGERKAKTELLILPPSF